MPDPLKRPRVVIIGGGFGGIAAAQKLKVEWALPAAAGVLRFCEDLSEAATAELMGCSVGTVKRQVFVALGKMRDHLGHDSAPPSDEQVVTP